MFKSTATLLAAIVFYGCCGIVLLALSANMIVYSQSLNTVCLNGPNPTRCHLMWLFHPACAVGVTAGTLALAGMIVGVLWLAVDERMPNITNYTYWTLRAFSVAFQIMPIIFGGIAGILFAAVSSSIFNYNGLIGFGDGATYNYAEQTAAAASFGFVVMALGFLLCGPSANHERIEYAQH